MPKKSTFVMPNGEELQGSKVPVVKSIKPFSSMILVESLNPEETIQTNIYLSEDTKIDTAAQAYVIEIGPKVSNDLGLKPGMRIHWQGTGLPVDDPNGTKGRVRALLEIHQIKAVINEEGAEEWCPCSGKCDKEEK